MALKELPRRAMSSSPLDRIRSLRLPSANRSATIAARRSGSATIRVTTKAIAPTSRIRAAPPSRKVRPMRLMISRSRCIG